MKNNRKLIKKEKLFQALEEAEAQVRVLYWFFDFPLKEVSLSDLSKNTGISKSTANKIVHRLVDIGFLKKEVLSRIWRIRCNLTHPYNLSIKMPYHLELIYQSGILEAIYKQIPNPRAIILFGSYRKGDDTEQSDIDIAIEVLGNERLKIIELGIIDKIGYRKNVKVNLHIFSRNKIDLNLFANIANGIVLAGFLEARP